MRFVLACGLALSLLPVAAQGAGDVGYNVQVLSFDMWCQETKGYPAERCDAREPADEAAFEQYRATVERYELPYLKRMEEERELRERVLEHDSSARHTGTGR
jgi:hypothetical protein